MKKVFFFLTLMLCVYLSIQAQPVERPKLVVGVVVDQMRWDYLYRFYQRYGQDGFRRLLHDGFSCENTFIPYTPTVTAAGHACIYTGSVPALNGILGNNWYDKYAGKNIYCVEDNSVQTVGGTSAAGKMSPKNLWATTITDELHVATNFTSKTISIALKDRASVLPGGHSANAAYWFDNATGGWISSTFYMNALPDWITKLNRRQLPDSLLQQNWNTLYPINTYVQSAPDDQPYENNLPGEDNTFPHITGNIIQNKYETFRHTPFGNTFTLETAKRAVEAEQLGIRGVTDFLAVSLSSTDHIGHTFGPNSVEIEDTYLRLDKDLGLFLQYLDKKIGQGQYLFFLTADHGIAHIAAWEKQHHITASVLSGKNLSRQITDAVKEQFNNPHIIDHISNNQIYLNDSMLLKSNVSKTTVKNFITGTLLKIPAIAGVIDLENLEQVPLPQKVKTMVTNGYNQKLSGTIQYIFKPESFDAGYEKGATHSAWNPYDAHIPLLWFGWKVKKGKLNREVYMTDIAPTVAALLSIQMPNACIGSVIEEVIR